MKSIQKKDIVWVLLLGLVVSALLRLFIFDVFIVKGDSMTPTIHNGDVVFISKLAYARKTPQRGDIIVVIPRNVAEKIIKRVIALPEERVEILDNRVVIKKDRTDTGEVLKEEYLELPDTPDVQKTVLNIDPREYFVLGDNRYMSTDSRELGPIDDWKIKGKVMFAINLRKLYFKPFYK